MCLPMHKMKETQVWSLGWEDPLEEGITTRSSILAWRIPMDREAWRTIVPGVAKNCLLLKQLSMHALTPLSTLFTFDPWLLFTQVFDPVLASALWRTRINKVIQSGIPRIWFLDDSWFLASFRISPGFSFCVSSILRSLSIHVSLLP